MFKNIVKNLVQKISPHKYFLIQLDITNACNLKCIHCYHPNHNNIGALNINQWFDVLDQIKDLLAKLYLEPEFTFCGGEPLLSKDLPLLIDRINTVWRQPKIAILTNGTILSKKHFEFLKPNQVEFQISLDGPNDVTHDKVRGNGNFLKSIGAIKLLVENGYNVSCLSVLSSNSFNSIQDFFILASGLKVKKMSFERFVTQGEGEKLYTNGMDKPLEGISLKNALEQIYRYSLQYNISTNTDVPLYCLIDDRLGHHNMVGHNGIVIDYKGNLRVTSRTNYIIGNILSEGLSKMYLNDPLLLSFRTGNIEECGDCKYYNRCGGSRNASYAKHRNFLKKDPGCWYK